MFRVCITYDVEGWAWHARAMAIQKYAPEQFDVTVCQQSHVPTDTFFDAVLHQCWAEPWPVHNTKKSWVMVASSGLMFDYPSTTPDDLWSRTASRLKNRTKAADRLDLFHGVICINPLATHFCKSIQPNTHFLTPGVDADFFCPPPCVIAPKSCRNRPLAIGWCGKPSTELKFSAKGYHEVLLPLKDRLADLDIQWCVNTHDSSTALSREEMKWWYQSLDLFLITSSIEGTPSTLLEAMACGVPVLSTMVGIAPYVAQFNVPTYRYVNEIPHAIDELERRLREFMDLDDTERQTLKVQARRRIDNLCHWRDKAELWLKVLVEQQLNQETQHDHRWH